MINSAIELSPREKNYNGIHTGHNFRLIPRSKIISSDFLSKINNHCFSALITLSIHINSNCCVNLSTSRISILAGISHKSTNEAIDIMLTQSPTIIKHITKKQYEITWMQKSDDDDCFSFFQAVIYRGIWANLKPSSRKLLVALRAFGEPFRDDQIYLTDSEYDKCAQESRCDHGKLMVIPTFELREIEELIGISSRTRSDAMLDLVNHGLLEVDCKNGRYILPNVPPIVFPDRIIRIQKYRDLPPSIIKSMAMNKANVIKIEPLTMNNSPRD